MVVDASAILALMLGEPPAAWVAARLSEHAGALCMSTVNLAETLLRLRDLQPGDYGDLERRLLGGPIRMVAPTTEHARIAVEARIRYPLNLGDCFAYALAVTEGAPLLTLDADFKKTDVPIVSPPR